MIFILLTQEMELKEIQKLRFRRQYVIASEKFECPFPHRCIMLSNKFFLYAHPDLAVTEASTGDTRIILLGDLFDYDPKIITNLQIAEYLVDYSLQEIPEKLSRYTGRYVIIFQQKGETRLFHDAAATRKIFYAKLNGDLWFASQPYLLGKILNLPESTISSKADFYKSADFIRLKNANIGDTTIYDEVFQVLPNHYFDIKRGRPVRYWPDKPIESLNIDETAKKCAMIIKGYMTNIIARYDIMLPVTAGKDSRLLLAATRGFKNKVYYYINKESGLDSKSNDLRIPISLFTKLGLDFHLCDPYEPVDENFSSIYFENNPRASEKMLPIIFNYYAKFNDKVNLPGNTSFEAFFKYKYQNLLITGDNLAKITRVSQYSFAKEYYDTWVANTEEVCRKNRVNPLNLFYCEERLTNWGSQISLEKDIAQEDINPYNSRLLITLFLGINYRLLLPPRYVFHKKIINQLWPDVLQEPFNPSFINKLKKVMEYMGLLNLIYKNK